MSVARFIADQRTNYAVPHTTVCALLGVSEAWFYKWIKRADGPGAASGLFTDTDRRRDTVDGPWPSRCARRRACTDRPACARTCARPDGGSARRRSPSRCAVRAWWPA